jgi:protein-S-isoprenylcysteine O-methyltransferase Ste14
MIVAIAGLVLLIAAYSIGKHDPDHYWSSAKSVTVVLLFFSGLFALMWGVMTWSQCL